MSRRKHLTPQQIKFVNLLVYNEGRKTATDCAIEAGYAKDRARSTASELQNSNYYPLVVQEITKLRKEIKDELPEPFYGLFHFYKTTLPYLIKLAFNSENYYRVDISKISKN